MLMKKYAGGQKDKNNPYGSQGGYVTQRNPQDRDMRMQGNEYARSDYSSDFARNDYERGDNPPQGQYWYMQRRIPEHLQQHLGYGSPDMRSGDYARGRDRNQNGIPMGRMDGHFPPMPYGPMSQGPMPYGPHPLYGYDMARGDYAGGDMARRDRNQYDMAGGDYGQYDMARRDRGGQDYGDYAQDDQEQGQYGKFSEKDIEKWKKESINADGTRGEHFRKEQVEQAAKQLGINMQQYGSEKVFPLAMNAMYAEYCNVARKYGADRPEYYAELAKTFLEGKTSDIKGEEKLWVHYKTMVEKEN